MKKQIKYIVLLNLLLLTIIGVYFASSFYFDLPLTYGTDIRTQHYQFYTEFERLIHQFIETRQFPFYSWRIFLGDNFWSSKAYYVVGDPYSYLGLLLGGHYFDRMRILTGLKYLVAGNTFYLLMNQRGHQPLTKITVSIAYAFSAWAIFFSGQTMFLSFYSLIPIYLLGVERYLRNGKWLTFSLSAAVLFSINYYLFYILSLLTIVYFTYQWFMQGKGKGFWKSAFKLIGYDLLGAGLTAFVWLPALIYITGSGRFRAEIGLLQPVMTYLNLLYAAFAPDYLYLYHSNVLETGSHFNREICLYFTATLVVLVPQYIKRLTKAEKKYTGLLSLFFCAVLILTYPASVLHGFGDPSYRWVFFIVIILLEWVATVLDRYDEIDPRLLSRTSISIICVMIGTNLIAYFLQDGSLASYRGHLYLTAAFACLYLLLPYMYRLKNQSLILIAVVLELGISGGLLYYKDTRGQKENETYAYLNQVTHVLETYEGELNDTILSADPDAVGMFYRVYVPLNGIYWDYSHNMSVFYDIKGLMTYDSSFAPSFLDLYALVPEVNDYESDWIFRIEDPDLWNYLNVRYAVVASGEDSPFEHTALLVEGYLGYLDIYLNQDYQPVGTTYEKLMTNEEYLTREDTSLFNDYVIMDNEQMDEIQSYLSDANGYTYNTYNYGNTLMTDIYSDQEGYMILRIPYDEGWKILIDGEQISYQRVGGGFIGIAVPEGTHHLEMYFVSKGFRVGVIISALSILGLLGCIILDRKHRRII